MWRCAMEDCGMRVSRQKTEFFCVGIQDPVKRSKTARTKAEENAGIQISWINHTERWRI